VSFLIGVVVGLAWFTLINLWIGWSPFTPHHCPRCGQWLSRDGLKRLALERELENQ